MTTAIVLNESEPVLSCECHEPEGSIIRNIYAMSLSPQNLKRFWDLASQFKTLFGDDVGGDFHKFAEMFITRQGDQFLANGLFWRIDDFVGIYYMTNIGEHDAQIHYSFFDRRHRGRIEMTRKMIQLVFKEYGFRRLTAEIPYYAINNFSFIERIGFIVEGRKRKAAMYNGEWFDVRCFGILREEAESWV